MGLRRRLHGVDKYLSQMVPRKGFSGGHSSFTRTSRGFVHAKLILKEEERGQCGRLEADGQCFCAVISMYRLCVACGNAMLRGRAREHVGCILAPTLTDLIEYTLPAQLEFRSENRSKGG